MVKEVITVREYTQDILSKAMGYDLVLLDLDDVVLTTQTYLCSSQWYYRYKHENHDKFEDKNIFADNIYDCMGNTTFIAVTTQLIADFSTLAQNKPVFGLTTRRIEFSANSNEHLNSIEMKFSSNLPEDNLINNGVIYCGYKPSTIEAEDKGLVLKTMLDKNYFGDVKSVLLIDDSLKNIQNVFNALDDDMHFAGIHFTKILSELKELYNEEQLSIIGQVQYEAFLSDGIFLSNEEALSIGNK